LKHVVLIAIFIFIAASVSHAQPDASFPQVYYDFGSVSNVNKVEHVFEVSNAGDKDLIIEKFVTSSGTVTAVASPSLLTPGDKGSIRVAVDLRGKSGIYTKTIDVYTNDPAIPFRTLSVKFSVPNRIPIGHYNADEIFAENCRACHVDKGKEKKGWDLFKADCFMCHNAGKDISLSVMSRKPKREVLKAIKEGVPNSLMPGFDLKNGGPLNEVQIKSIIELITS
jgi:hypothetical protein